MKKNEKTSHAGTNEVKSKEHFRKSDHLYCITFILALTTIIAGWHITDIWDAVITALCGSVTMWLSFGIIGESR